MYHFWEKKHYKKYKILNTVRLQRYLPITGIYCCHRIKQLQFSFILFLFIKSPSPFIIPKSLPENIHLKIRSFIFKYS